MAVMSRRPYEGTRRGSGQGRVDRVPSEANTPGTGNTIEYRAATAARGGFAEIARGSVTAREERKPARMPPLRSRSPRAAVAARLPCALAFRPASLRIPVYPPWAAFAAGGFFLPPRTPPVPLTPLPPPSPPHLPTWPPR